MPVFGKINLKFGFAAEFVNSEVKSVPSYMEILLNLAIPSFTGTVMSSQIEKTSEELPKAEEVAATGPLLSVKFDGAGVILLQSTKKVTVARAAVLERGKYPIFLANETTFSLNVALSMKTSFATMLALYEVMYVLYANTSKTVDKFDPSKL